VFSQPHDVVYLIGAHAVAGDEMRVRTVWIAPQVVCSHGLPSLAAPDVLRLGQRRVLLALDFVLGLASSGERGSVGAVSISLSEVVRRMIRAPPATN